MNSDRHCASGAARLLANPVDGSLLPERGRIRADASMLHAGVAGSKLVVIEGADQFAAAIEKRLCNYNARDLKQNEILRAATAHDATASLYEMDAVLREREDAAAQSDPGAIADSMASHMSAYMEVSVPHNRCVLEA